MKKLNIVMLGAGSGFVISIARELLHDPVFADANNYKEILIDSGYYTEDQLQ